MGLTVLSFAGINSELVDKVLLLLSVPPQLVILQPLAGIAPENWIGVSAT